MQYDTQPLWNIEEEGGGKREEREKRKRKKHSRRWLPRMTRVSRLTKSLLANSVSFMSQILLLNSSYIFAILISLCKAFYLPLDGIGLEFLKKLGRGELFGLKILLHLKLLKNKILVQLFFILHLKTAFIYYPSFCVSSPGML